MSKTIITLMMLAMPFGFAAAKAQELSVIAENAPPNAFFVEGVKTGRAYDVVQAVLARADMAHVPIKIYPWARGYKLLHSDHPVALFPTSRTEQREDQFYWVGPIFSNDIYLYKLTKRADIQGTVPDDFRPYRIGVGLNDVKDQFFTSRGFLTERVSADKQNIAKLHAGRLDLIAYAAFRFDYDVQKMGFDGGDFRKVTKIRSISTPAYIAFSKSTDRQLVRRIATAFRSLVQDGQHEKILRHWGG